MSQFIDLEELREWIINNEVPYATSPRGFWKQSDGKLCLISSMESSHLEACCKLIKKDMNRMEGRPNEIKDDLFIMMESKYKELKDKLISRLDNI